MSNSLCRLCASSDTRLYKDSPKVLECRKCGLVFLAPELINHDLDSYYKDNVFYAGNATNPYLIESMIASAIFYLKTIIKYVHPIKGQVLVDVGSNYGVLVKEASKLGFNAIGLEKNSTLVSMSKERGLNVLSCDLIDLNISSPVKVITVMHVLEHLIDPRAFIKEVYNKLSPGGFVVIAVPNINSYLAQKDALSWRYFALEHLFYFSQQTLTQLLQEEGFTVVAVKHDSTNLAGQGIKKLLHYLWGKPLTRDRFQAKSYEGRKVDRVPPKKISRIILKQLIIFAIRILRREDFVLVVAQKN